MESDAAGVFEPDNAVPDHFGVRDVSGDWLWVEFETGEGLAQSAGPDKRWNGGAHPLRRRRDLEKGDENSGPERVRVWKRLTRDFARTETPRAPARGTRGVDRACV